jgi:threonine/homoserine/homoserine lactone efflux protein
MSLAQVTSFTLLVALLTILPGADVALILRAARTESKRVALITGVGISAGCLVWGAATAEGLSALLIRYPQAYRTISVLGGLYLLWLGWSALRATRTSAGASSGASSGAGSTLGFRSGFLTNLLNPKVGVFYLSLLPQFAPPGPGLLWRSLVLAGIHALLSLSWFAILIFLFSRELPNVLARALPWVTALALTLFGLRTIFLS